MTKFLSYLPDEAIEKDAQALLTEYAHARDCVIEAPVAIDEIVEKYLKISMEFDDMHRLFGVPRSDSGFYPDIFGAIFFEQKRIVIDESLDPEENPIMEGRYRFTAAHEVGHWRLHRRLFCKNPAQTSYLGDNPPPSVVCRSSAASARIELQADRYASCLLMPRKLVLDHWHRHFGDPAPRIYNQRHQTAMQDYPECAAQVKEFEDEGLNKLVQPIAKCFLVSPVAMRIRVEKLGLLLRKASRPQLLTNLRPLF